MLFNIIEGADYYKHINPNTVIFFEYIGKQLLLQSFSDRYKKFLKERPSDQMGWIISLDNYLAKEKSNENTVEVQKPIAKTSSIDIPEQKMAYYGVLKKRRSVVPFSHRVRISTATMNYPIAVRF